VFIEIADGVYEELVELNAFVGRVSCFSIRTFFRKLLAYKVCGSLAIDLCGEFFVAGHEPEHSKGDVFGLSGFEG